MQKPQLSFWHIWNMCFGFFGIQFGFALQNSNVSRIFQTLGADYSNMTILWVAAPITGLFVQPIIGYMSDNTWGKLGRRRPYFLYGAIVASLSLLIMPNSPTLWIAAGMLWIMDASINVSMEPFRAFVGDMLPRNQRGLGYAMQSFFIGVASVIASALPWMMTNWFGISNEAELGKIPESVKFAFYAGGILFFLAVLWTVVSTKEYSPEELEAFERAERELDNQPDLPEPTRSSKQFFSGGFIWAASGIVSTILVAFNIEALDKNLLLLTSGLLLFGVFQIIAGLLEQTGNNNNGFSQIMVDLFNMPDAMRKLAVVQFFSWFPFFAWWSSSTPAITSHHYGTSDVASAAFNQGADWVGILNSAYNVAAVFAAISIPFVVRWFNLRIAHTANLLLGGIGFISFILIKDPKWLVVPMIGVGFAWASILSLPYALLSNSVPMKKMGLFMGIFNFFIVLPQILAASILGFLVNKFFGGQTIFALVIGGSSMVLAGLLTLRVQHAD
ncbi:SLC45 family MFS transporter [Aliikangiella marina]|uniref:SLC45 family MFS transporter n=1 Tax=Aliikangiella marina TaxID=1712262 RepID=A0A545TCV7_9GAMM|nr:MFS transporter [Aliikangiella marina]TQV75047.1 SLC45 family MFS transporter [Aliikangiella marina]